MKRIMISQILQNSTVNKDYTVSGWVRTKRGSKHVAFIMLNDGSCLHDMQIIIEDEKLLNSIINLISTGTSISVLGTLTKSKGKGQKLELIAKEITIIGDADSETYPIQPKKHTLDFLRKNAHLRFRTKTYSSIFRIRHALSFAIHKFFTMEGSHHLNARSYLYFQV